MRVAAVLTAWGTDGGKDAPCAAETVSSGCREPVQRIGGAHRQRRRLQCQGSGGSDCYMVADKGKNPAWLRGMIFGAALAQSSTGQLSIIGAGMARRNLPLGNLAGSVRSIVSRIWVWMGGGHLAAPVALGAGDHDCAPVSLYWAAPWIPESRIVEAFLFCAENWPYGGVTNKEFQIVLKYLGAGSDYFDDSGTLGTLLAGKPSRCVALLHGHFIAIINGKIVGRDARRAWDLGTEVYCYWIFRSRRSQPAESFHRTFGSTT